MAKWITRKYRKVFGRKSPYRRVYGSRTAGQAIGVTYRQVMPVVERVTKLAAEVAKIRANQNNEKKHVDTLVGGQVLAVGQVNGNVAGWNGASIMPSISQGVGHNQRVGNSIKMTGCAIKYQVIGQTNTLSARKLKMHIIKVKSADNGVTLAEAVDMLFDVNPLTGVVDYHSPRNYNNASNHGVSIVKTKTVYVPAPQHNITSTEVDHSHVSGTVSLKLSEIFRYASAGSTTPEGETYYLVIMSDIGNISTGTPSTLPVPVVSAQSGLNVSMHQRWWWVDN